MLTSASLRALKLPKKPLAPPPKPPPEKPPPPLKPEPPPLAPEDLGVVTAAAPKLLDIFGVGIDTAATLLVAAGDNPQRIGSEAQWAMLCGIAPIPVMTGRTAASCFSSAYSKNTLSS